MPLRDDIDAALTTLWPHLVARQNAYFAAKGRYFQGIATHVVIPADGATGAPNKTRKPTDQTENWTDAGINLPAQMPMSLRLDVYDGPKGKGWAATVIVAIANRKFARTRNMGPETSRDSAWNAFD